jgi:hypothetical protein
MKAVEIRPWRKSPFEVGHQYRVRSDFKALRDNFRAGEMLTFERDAYSHYHGYTGYFFSQTGTEQIRVWDIHDGENLSCWRELFEEVPSDS